MTFIIHYFTYIKKELHIKSPSLHGGGNIMILVIITIGCLVPLRHGIDMVIEPFNNVQQLMGCVCHGIAQIIKIGSIHHAINNRSLTNDNSIHDDDNDDNELK
jgi:hypothetical protein